MEKMTPLTAMALQEVKRWHTRRVDRDQTVASHTASMMALALVLAEPHNLISLDLCDLMQLVLVHDAHETVFGDCSYPARMALKALGIDIDGICRKTFWGGVDPYDKVSPLVRNLVDVADQVEAAMWSQRNAPNLAAQVVAQAVETSRQLLDNQGQAQVLEMLGIRPEVDR